MLWNVPCMPLQPNLILLRLHTTAKQRTSMHQPHLHKIQNFSPPPSRECMLPMKQLTLNDLAIKSQDAILKIGKMLEQQIQSRNPWLKNTIANVIDLLDRLLVNLILFKMIQIYDVSYCQSTTKETWESSQQLHMVDTRNRILYRIGMLAATLMMNAHTVTRVELKTSTSKQGYFTTRASENN